MTRAVEFFSGLGSFSYVARTHGIEVVQAFDQSQAANQVYRLNFGLEPESWNLDTISADQIMACDLWWISPPCAPYSVRGRQRDLADPRARSLVNVISLAGDLLPRFILLENVLGFAGSQAHALVLETLTAHGYQIQEISLCPTDFGIPMRRPRRFIIAARDCPIVCLAHPVPAVMRSFTEFLMDEYPKETIVEASVVERYARAMNIVRSTDVEAILICFTRGYWRCLKASGSFLLLPNETVRRFSPDEILSLFGFKTDFAFPEEMAFPTRWALLGNAVHLPAIELLLACVKLPQNIA